MILPVQSRRGGRVLLVEPDDDIRRSYKHVFERAGWDVIEASDGREALATALVDSPSIIITEIQLPFIDGYSLCEVLRRDFLTRAVPILLLTSDMQSPDIERARTLGADAVLGKPITGDEVLTHVERVVQQCEERARASDTAPRKKSANARSARFETTTPPAAPAQLSCSSCDSALTYQQSYVGGVATKTEQWDYFECPAGCGTFQYRRRTGRLRRSDITISTAPPKWQSW
jgi:DNA-binding response OmpR family regulator